MVETNCFEPVVIAGSLSTGAALIFFGLKRFSQWRKNRNNPVNNTPEEKIIITTPQVTGDLPKGDKYDVLSTGENAYHTHGDAVQGLADGLGRLPTLPEIFSQIVSGQPGKHSENSSKRTKKRKEQRERAKERKKDPPNQS